MAVLEIWKRIHVARCLSMLLLEQAEAVGWFAYGDGIDDTLSLCLKDENRERNKCIMFLALFISVLKFVDGVYSIPSCDTGVTRMFMQPIFKKTANGRFEHGFHDARENEKGIDRAGAYNS
jgi:hypothetical protein